MIKLTEQEFKELHGMIYESIKCLLSENYLDRLQKAKEKGWIEKTALEEARDYVNKIFRNSYYENEKDVVSACSDLYEKAIKEIQGS